jgi:hypothetical protein
MAKSRLDVLVGYARFKPWTFSDMSLQYCRSADWGVFKDVPDATYAAQNKQAAYGSMYPVDVALLRAKLTLEQTQKLEDLVKQYGGTQ